MSLAPGNRILTWALRNGVAPAAFALIETVGRHSGEPRTTPIGNGMCHDDDTFWIIAAHGEQADWVRNIRADPRVRIRTGRTWRPGTATVLPDDDTRRRSSTLPYQWDAAVGRALASTPLTIRVDLDT